MTKTIYTAQIQYIRIRQRLRNTSTGAIVEPTLRYDDTGVVNTIVRWLNWLPEI